MTELRISDVVKAYDHVRGVYYPVESGPYRYIPHGESIIIETFSQNLKEPVKRFVVAHGKSNSDPATVTLEGSEESTLVPPGYAITFKNGRYGCKVEHIGNVELS